MIYTDDPHMDFNRWDAEQERLLNALPKCYACGEPIQDLYLYRLDGEDYCEDCAFNWLYEQKKEVTARYD